MTPSDDQDTAAALAVLSRIRGNRRPPDAGERCEMCAEPIAPTHQHVVDLHTRSLMCTCRGCYLLFTDQQAQLRHRAVPDRYLSFPGTVIDQVAWDRLEIPVGLAFFFTNSRLIDSTQNATVAFYPGPAGAAESELPLAGWREILAAHPELGVALPDVEAVLVRAPGAAAPSPGQTTSSSCSASTSRADCWLVPIDACYQLVGVLRSCWRGFDGGRDAHAEIERFFTGIASRSKPFRPGVAP